MRFLLMKMLNLLFLKNHLVGRQSKTQPNANYFVPSDDIILEIIDLKHSKITSEKNTIWK